MSDEFRVALHKELAWQLDQYKEHCCIETREISDFPDRTIKQTYLEYF